MIEKTKIIKKICECKNCGNEAEMVVTCTLTEIEAARDGDASNTGKETHANQVKGSATCSHCGNEADMWIGL